MNISAAAAAKKISKAQEKAKALRDSVWPDLDEEMLWNRKSVSGLDSTAPRLQASDVRVLVDTSGGFGADGQVLFDLTGRNPAPQGGRYRNPVDGEICLNCLTTVAFPWFLAHVVLFSCARRCRRSF